MEENGIDVKTLGRMVAAHPDVTLLDVRRKTDYDSSPAIIPGARWRDPEKIDQWRAELAAGRSTVVYCVKGGPVSQSVTDRLRQEGFEVFYLKGGLKAWTDEGKAVK